MVGRIRRHRNEKYDKINVHILNKNIKGIKGKEICFEKPGFETDKNKLKSHELKIILSNDQLTNIDSRHRIKEEQQEIENLVSLEHKSIREKLNQNPDMFHSNHWLNKNVQLTGIVQKKLPFRKKTIEERTYVVLEENGKLTLKEFDYKSKEYKGANNKFKYSSYEYDNKIKPWKEFSIQECINDICSKEGIDKEGGYYKYSKAQLSYNENNPNGWEYNNLLGLKPVDNK
jgi:CRISPR-associated endonuclease/helicase Cas3